ncbi:copper homeostasis protein CutC [Paratractidigestivibacter sp.]|uniref:copper homeostasis protein CutC n=1 Tax=Paratractidigestivibacter sp. TaxID=2847316 RepID=UPI002AC972C8|nr:copper homeostasis protein CutC [Paratractidigestivibacter sp.]
MIREFCAENVEHVPAALAAGAGRVELCDNLACGGTTPSGGVIREAVGLCHSNNAQVMCMIRPRGGSFGYTGSEARIMADDLAIAADLGVDGVVFGCLRDCGLDRELTSRLVGLARERGLLTTFHMAFDELAVGEALDAVDWLAELGMDRILTHGGPAGTPIEENLDRLRIYVERAAGRIKILPGGGITWENADTVASALGVDEVHGTRIVRLG